MRIKIINVTKNSENNNNHFTFKNYTVNAECYEDTKRISTLLINVKTLSEVNKEIKINIEKVRAGNGRRTTISEEMKNNTQLIRNIRRSLLEYEIVNRSIM